MLLHEAETNELIQSDLSRYSVVLSPIYHLCDLDYKIYVIMDNVLELPLDQHQSVSAVVNMLFRN